MIKALMIILLCGPLLANACNATKHMIDKLVASGDVIITFKPNGEVSQVNCNIAKYTQQQCEKTGEKVFDYYQKHRKGIASE